jgi:hypothetical protein
MIKFSQFLQDNEKKKTEADSKKTEESKVEFFNLDQFRKLKC